MSCQNNWTCENTNTGQDYDYCKITKSKCDGEKKDCKCGKYQEAKYNEPLINSKGIRL